MFFEQRKKEADPGLDWHTWAVHHRMSVHFYAVDFFGSPVSVLNRDFTQWRHTVGDEVEALTIVIGMRLGNFAQALFSKTLKSATLSLIKCRVLAVGERPSRWRRSQSSDSSRRDAPGQFLPTPFGETLKSTTLSPNKCNFIVEIFVGAIGQMETMYHRMLLRLWASKTNILGFFFSFIFTQEQSTDNADMKARARALLHTEWTSKESRKRRDC